LKQSFRKNHDLGLGGFVRRRAGVISICFLIVLSLNLHSRAYAQVITKRGVPANPLKSAPPEQPIAYSHKQHLAQGLECQSCHTNPDPGKLMTFPASSRCAECHKNADNKPGLKKLNAYTKANQPIPWVRVYKLLPGVNWSHRRHLDAGVSCVSCHGPVAQLERMSELTSVTSMSVCIDCHDRNHAQTTCNTCHSGPGNSAAEAKGTL
jgi:cytochrome c7-like protein/class III cytochrome C family protein